MKQYDKMLENIAEIMGLLNGMWLCDGLPGHDFETEKYWKNNMKINRKYKTGKFQVFRGMIITDEIDDKIPSNIGETVWICEKDNDAEDIIKDILKNFKRPYMLEIKKIDKTKI